jgi:hypothetical protein
MLRNASCMSTFRSSSILVEIATSRSWFSGRTGDGFSCWSVVCVISLQGKWTTSGRLSLRAWSVSS